MVFKFLLCFLFNGGGHLGLPLVFSFGGDNSFNTVTVIIYIIYITYSPKIDSQVGCGGTCNPVLGSTGQEGFCKFEVSMRYIVSYTRA